MKRKDVMTALAVLRAGQMKLAELVNSQEKISPEDQAQIDTIRDSVTQKLAAANLIDRMQAAAFRSQFDRPGGVDHLLGQVVEQLLEAKTASAAAGAPASALGASSPSKPSEKVAGFPVANQMRRDGGQSYQSPYHR